MTSPNRPTAGLMSLEDAAAYLDMPVNTVRYWTYTTRALPSYRIGRRRKVKRADLDALIERGLVAAYAPALKVVAR